MAAIQMDLKLEFLETFEKAEQCLQKPCGIQCRNLFVEKLVISPKAREYVKIATNVLMLMLMLRKFGNVIG